MVKFVLGVAVTVATPANQICEIIEHYYSIKDRRSCHSKEKTVADTTVCDKTALPVLPSDWYGRRRYFWIIRLFITRVELL
jgi:hypothetical protein